MSKPVIGFVGMTHLGINSAAAAAGQGAETVCFDTDATVIAQLKSGKLSIVEPGLPELLEQNNSRITYTAEAGDLKRCGVVYISADVPTDDQGQSDFSGILALIDTVAAGLGRDAILVILCQVPPGFTRSLSLPKERLYYQVETLIFGRAVERAMSPERFIVGCAEPQQPLPPVFAHFLESFGCPILPMRYESAELAKISINMCLVASVSVANTLAELCENIGADWSEVVPALKLDKRIGQYAYLAPGLGIAGGNLERDLATVLALSEQYGTDGGIVSAWVANSRYRKDWTWRTLNRLVLAQDPGARIAVLGLAYKEDTHSTKNSPSLSLLSYLQNYPVVVYDPVVSSSDAGILFKSASNAMEAVQDVDVVCIMTPWEEFKQLSSSDLAKRMRGRWLIDPYRVIDGKAARAAGLRHITLGIVPEKV